MSRILRRAVSSGMGAFFLLLFVSAGWGAEAKDPLEKIEHLVVIYQKNWSFDGLYGRFPGANGIETGQAIP